jgi:hypothetical protein
MGLTVHQWIDSALKAGRNAYLPVPMPQKVTLIAWSSLKGMRQDPAFQTDNALACAEHYMFARWISSVGGIGVATAVSTMAVGYQLYKVQALVAKRAGINLPTKTGAGPATPPSAAQMYWGLRGAQRGMMECPTGMPLGTMGFAAGVWQEIIALLTSPAE